MDTNKRGKKRKNNQNEANLSDLITINENYISEIGAKQKAATIGEDEPIAKRKTTRDENSTQRFAFLDLTSSEINIHKTKANPKSTITSEAIIDVDQYNEPSVHRKTTDGNATQHIAFVDLTSIEINNMKAQPTATITSGATIDFDQYIFDNATASSIASTVSDLSNVQDTVKIAQVPVTINQTTIVPENVSVFSGSEDEVPTDRTNTFIPHETVDIMPKPGVNGTYSELQKLEHHLGMVLNTKPFECDICFEDIEPNDGIVLRNCLHSFCKLCITSLILHGEDIIAKCPYMGDDFICVEEIQEREIRDLLTEEQFEKYLKRTISFAEQNTINSFHCKKPDCTGWCECDDNVNTFCCPVCYSHNCINCGAIHTGKNCREYQDDLILNDVDKESKNSIERLIAEGAAMRCPKCQIVIVKRDGCDGLMCTTCRTEICWATKGFRWGPDGFGDTSGGCKCDWENDQPCHPDCQDCH